MAATDSRTSSSSSTTIPTGWELFSVSRVAGIWCPRSSLPRLPSTNQAGLTFQAKWLKVHQIGGEGRKFPQMRTMADRHAVHVPPSADHRPGSRLRAGQGPSLAVIAARPDGL